MIFIENETDQKFPDELVERAARAALDLSGAPDADLTVVLGGDDRIQSLNRDFLKHDSPTDVLSFPANEADPESGRLYLGDVVISLPQATKQAAERGHPLEAEVQLLVAHGTLHLLGHDHADPQEKSRMWAAQGEILKNLGLSAGYCP